MDSQRFNLPDVSSLREGIDYRVIGWDFANQQPAHVPGESCGPGEKVVFGVCRKLRNGTSSGEKDFDSASKSKQEQGLEAEAAKQGSSFQTNKAVLAGGKKYGWAMKGGKPVMVQWGSVAGEKKVGPAKPKQTAGAQNPTATSQPPSASPAPKP